MSHGASPRRCIIAGDVTRAAGTGQHLLGCDDDVQTFPSYEDEKAAAEETQRFHCGLFTLKGKYPPPACLCPCVRACMCVMMPDWVIDEDTWSLPVMTSSTPKPMGHPVSISSRYLDVTIINNNPLPVNEC